MEGVVDLSGVIGAFEHALTYILKRVTRPTLWKIYWDWEDE